MDSKESIAQPSRESQKRFAARATVEAQQAYPLGLGLWASKAHRSSLPRPGGARCSPLQRIYPYPEGKDIFIYEANRVNVSERSERGRRLREQEITK